VDPKYGSEAELRELVGTAHRLGLKVLFDMVIHGFNPASLVVVARPDLFIKDEAGKPALHPTWKSVSTDWAGSAYRQYMADLVRHDVRTYGIDGYRVDAASYKGPAWEAALPYPAYRPGAAAPELMAHMLRALREGRPEGVLLSEVFGPVFYSVSNLAHDNQTEAPQLLLERMEMGQYTAAQYQEHLASVADALPAGANRVFFARNHDTSWFFHFNGYTPAFLALEAVHALFGIPEVFAGDPENGPHPDADPGVYNYYRKLFRLKKEFTEWMHGRLRLRDVRCDNPHVFTGLRSTDTHTGLTLVSLSGKAEVAPVFLGAGVSNARRLVLRDALTGESVTVPREDDRFVFHLRPYQVLVGRIE
jgi:glycosidase